MHASLYCIIICIIIYIGRYSKDHKPPFDVGMEGTGEIVWIGDNVKSRYKIGDAVGFMESGTFSQYQVIPASRVFPLPSLKPEYTAILVSGPTASVSLEVFGDIKSANKTVLVTAAAGGTGQFAVQLAKLAGCHVIGTCSTDDKVKMLKSLGCSRVINYVKEDLGTVLRNEYPKGIDLVYESVGGDIFNTCVKNLAVGGQLIIIGMISHYQGSSFSVKPTIPIQQLLLMKSASLRGFFLPHFIRTHFTRHINNLAELYNSGSLKISIDSGEGEANGPFKGISSVPNAVEYLYSKRSKGKIVVDLWEDQETTFSSKL